jgi:hypothetical protein
MPARVGAAPLIPARSRSFATPLDNLLSSGGLPYLSASRTFVLIYAVFCSQLFSCLSRTRIAISASKRGVCKWCATLLCSNADGFSYRLPRRVSKR